MIRGVIHDRLPREFRSSVCSAHKEPLHCPVFYKGRFWTTFTAHGENSTSIVVDEFGVDIREEQLTNSVFDQIDEVKAHLILVREAIRCESYS